MFKSNSLTDKILAVLCDVRNPKKYFRELLIELYKLPERERRDYLKKLLNLLTIRPKLVEDFKLGVKKMPITFDRETIEKHPFFKDGKQEGKKEAVIKLHKKLKMSAKEIAEVLELPLDFVENVLKENRT